MIPIKKEMDLDIPRNQRKKNNGSGFGMRAC
jgi:hypothetical protein